VGGQERDDGASGKQRYRFQRGLILKLDIASGRTELCADYVSPPDVCPEGESSVLFKAGTLHRDRLYVCTETEILIYSLPSFAITRYLSLPLFNDLHHVRPTRPGNLLVANTGLDMVVEVTPEGEVLREWDVLGQSPWTRFDRHIDYRKVVTTKPHASHPNHVFQIGDEVWATRFEQRDALCLTSADRRIDIGIEGPHDGTVVGNDVYFTTVDGHVVIAEIGTGRIRQVVDLNRFGRSIQILGWCRGLHVLDPDHVLVGFSRVRATTNPENLRWIYRKLPAVRDFRWAPTQVVLYDIRRGRRVWEHVIEEAGMNAIFSIHPADT
jgi:hypothetical protein